jgi:hypothetical protein
MRELPTGTVTFLFTDIEGSTRLLNELGDAYPDALADHRRLLRDAFDRHGGVEVDTQGDAFFVAFARASDALGAATDAQEALGGGPVKVRIGLHTGEPLITDEGYVGIDVHRAARIAAAGHGGQVLVSQTTHDLAGADGLRDLGEHRLKDLSAPERIFQLGDHDYPPLKTLYQTNLPVPATPFLGREDELAAVGDLLADTDLRLLTLTGAGGSGKTRLALQAAGAAADGYPGGVWWVPLAPVNDPEAVFETAAAALGVSGSLEEAIGQRRLLLLLDNLEHLIEAAPRLSPLLASCPNLDMVVTSRERLQLQGEHVYPVPVLARSEARALFTARARAVSPDFEETQELDELCARLDDLPLALELAAARTAILSTEQLLSRLGSRLDLLRGGRDARSGSRRCGRRSSGRTTCSRRTSSVCLHGWRCSEAAARSRRRRRSATPISTGSNRSSTRASSACARTSASGCSRRSGSSPPSGCATPARRTRSGAGTPSTSFASPSRRT